MFVIVPVRLCLGRETSLHHLVEELGEDDEEEEDDDSFVGWLVGWLRQMTRKVEDG